MTDRPPEPDSSTPTLRFGIRSVLVFTLLAAALLALAKWAGFLWAAVVAWFAVLVAAHIVGNAFGTKAYRTGSPLPRDKQPPGADGAEPDAAVRSVRQQQAEGTRQVHGVGIGKLCFSVTIAGVVIGALVAGALMMIVLHETSPWTSLNAIILATLSGATLGGFLGFFCSSFVDVFRGYLQVATAGLKADEDRKRRAAEALRE